MDTLEIGQSFVRALATDPADATITSTIVQMAHAPNLAARSTRGRSGGCAAAAEGRLRGRGPAISRAG